MNKYSLEFSLLRACLAVMLAASLLVMTIPAQAAPDRPMVTITVNDYTDNPTPPPSASNCPGTNCRLRDALLAAGTGDTIQFDDLGGSQTIPLQLGPLVVNTDNLTLKSGTVVRIINSNNNAPVVFDIEAAHFTIDTSLIGRNFGLTKTGPGELILAGSAGNYFQYDHPTNVDEGLLTLNNTSGVGFGGTLTVGDGLGAAASVVWQQNNTWLDNGIIVVNSDGLLDINNHIDVIDTLTLNYGMVSLGTGLLTSQHAITLSGGASVIATPGGLWDQGNLTTWFGPVLASGAPTISSKFDVADAAVNITVDPSSTLVLNGEFVSRFASTGSITKLGDGSLVFNSSGTFYAPPVTVSAGVLTGHGTVGNLTVNGTGSVVPDGLGLTVSGSWTNNSSVSSVGGTLILGGATAANLGGSTATTFNNLTINNAAGVTLSGVDATVNGQLNLAAGDLIVPSGRTLNLGSSSTAAGTFDVVGAASRSTIVNGTTYPFGNPNVQLTFNSGTAPSNVTVILAKIQPVSNPFAVDRSYTIAATGGSGYAATLRLAYKDSELHLANGASETNLHIIEGPSWAVWTRTGGDTTANFVETNNVTSFSEWSLAGNYTPSVLELNQLIARPNGWALALPISLGLLALGGGTALMRRRLSRP